MASMDSYPKAAMERAMNVQNVMLQAIAKKITWWQAAEILGISDPHMRPYWRQRMCSERGMHRRRGHLYIGDSRSVIPISCPPSADCKYCRTSSLKVATATSISAKGDVNIRNRYRAQLTKAGPAFLLVRGVRLFRNAWPNQWFDCRHRSPSGSGFLKKKCDQKQQAAAGCRQPHRYGKTMSLCQGAG